MIKSFLFGKTKEGRDVKGYEIDNEKGLRVVLIEYGAIIKNIYVCDKDGIYRDLVLGYDDVKGYEEDPYFMGAVVGRSANRIRNGAFVLNNKKYQMDQNCEGIHNLHSGLDYYNKRVWASECKENKVSFSLHSPDMDQGFPGNMDINVTYELTDNSLLMTTRAVSDKDTVCNITNHTYWNLNGEGCGDILKHSLWIPSEYITGTDDCQIADGSLFPVRGTSFDFNNPKTIGEDIDGKEALLVNAAGYDHNYCVDGSGKREFAKLVGDESKISMTLKSTLPGFQFYAGNYLNTQGNHLGKSQKEYGKRSGIALEPQYYPNAINLPEFEAPIIKAQKEFVSVIEYVFTLE